MIDERKKHMKTFKTADILIPQNIDLSKWSVVACDQYTSEPDYWNDVKNIVADAPSALNITFPEIYLENGDADERIKNINSTMEKYINDGIFKEYPNSFIYVERDLGNGRIRKGLVGAVDLEDYDFNKGSVSYVRATEGTVKTATAMITLMIPGPKIATTAMASRISGNANRISEPLITMDSIIPP